MCIGCGKFMGLPFAFEGAPRGMLDIADDGLTAIVDGDVLSL